MMMEKLSVTESKKRWDPLWKRQSQIQQRQQLLMLSSSPSYSTSTTSHDDDDDGDDNDDPFSCQAMTIPPLQTVVESVLDDFAARWEQLDHRKIVAPSLPNDNDNNNYNINDSDNTSQGVVEDPVKQQQQRRQQHHQKGTEEEDESDGDDNAQSSSPPKKRKRATGTAAAATTGRQSTRTTKQQKPLLATKWNSTRLKLPEGFDYMTQRSEPPTPPPPPPPPDAIINGTGESNSNNINNNTSTCNEDRIISLTDPTETISYEVALWELFRQVPTYDEIRSQLFVNNSRNSNNDNNNNRNHNHTSNKNDITTILPNIYESYQEVKDYSRTTDAHSLSRMRMNDRHGVVPVPLPRQTSSSSLPPLPSPAAISTDNNNNSNINSNHDDDDDDNVTGSNNINNNNNNNSTISTIRFECWRRQPKRGTAPSTDRAVMEFLGTQTLADVHETIVELTQDDLWNFKHVRSSSSSSSISLTSARSSLNRDQNKDNSNNNDNDNSGYFFIENIFYTTGSVDYTTTIQTWLNAGKEEGSQDNIRGNSVTPRKSVLGIITSSSLLPVKTMSETRLKDLPFRLAVRYQHVHHGDVECSIFVTDINHHHTTSKSNNNFVDGDLTYPLIHDIWTAAFPSSQDCEACQRFPASFATSHQCYLTQGHRALCQNCVSCISNRTVPRKSKQSSSDDGDGKSSDGGGNCDGEGAYGENDDGSNSSSIIIVDTIHHRQEEELEQRPMMVLPYPVWRNQSALSTGVYKGSRLF